MSFFQTIIADAKGRINSGNDTYLKGSIVEAGLHSESQGNTETDSSNVFTSTPGVAHTHIPDEQENSFGPLTNENSVNGEETDPGINNVADRANDTQNLNSDTGNDRNNDSVIHDVRPLNDNSDNAISLNDLKHIVLNSVTDNSDEGFQEKTDSLEPESNEGMVETIRQTEHVEKKPEILLSEEPDAAAEHGEAKRTIIPNYELLNTDTTENPTREVSRRDGAPGLKTDNTSVNQQISTMDIDRFPDVNASKTQLFAREKQVTTEPGKKILAVSESRNNIVDPEQVAADPQTVVKNKDGVSAIPSDPDKDFSVILKSETTLKQKEKADSIREQAPPGVYIGQVDVIVQAEGKAIHRNQTGAGKREPSISGARRYLRGL